MRERFSRLFGNEDARLRLSEAVINGSLPHALLITGPRGSGKHTLAREIAAAMNCKRKNEDGYALPCGECNNCKRIYGGGFPDISLLGRSSGKATIGVEELRDFREDMFLSPTESAYKFYIIEDADLMTPAAQNALLKVLEEPPAAVHILLLASEADKMLSTIKSRTQSVSTEIFGYDTLLSHVCRLSPTARAMAISDRDKLRAILLASGGIIGDATAMLDDGRVADIEAERRLISDFVDAISKKAPFSRLYASVMALPQKREELRHMLEVIRAALRDMTAARIAQDIAPIFFLSREAAEEAAGSIGKKRLIAIFDIITSALEDIDKNVLIQPLLTDIAVRIKEA